MIKVLLILSSVMLIATAIFGVLNRTAFLGERDEKNRLNDEWKVVDDELEQVSENLQDTKEDLDTTKDERDEQDAKLTLAKEKLMNKESSVKELSETLAEEKVKLKEFDVILAKFKDENGNMISIEDLRDKREKMNQELADRKAELQSLDAKVADANAAVEVAENTQATAASLMPALLEELELESGEPTSGRSSAGVVFSAMVGDEPCKITYNMGSGAVTARPDSTPKSAIGTKSFLQRLHMSRGYTPNMNTRTWWAVPWAVSSAPGLPPAVR